MTVFLDIETLDFFQDAHIKALPRDQQLKAMCFGCAVTCFVNDEVASDEPVWQEWTANQIDALYHYLCWCNQQICGWNSLAFDWPVIINSAERAGVQLLEIEHETVRHADLFDFIKQKTGRWYSLEVVAQHNLGRGKLADGQKAAEWLRSGDADLVAKALEYCRYDVQLTMDIAAILKRGEPLRLPPRPQRQELNEVLIWNDGRTERIPDATGAVSTK